MKTFNYNNSKNTNARYCFIQNFIFSSITKFIKGLQYLRPRILSNQLSASTIIPHNHYLAIYFTPHTHTSINLPLNTSQAKIQHRIKPEP